MNRRGFLGAILAAGIAPAYVKASSLMPVVSRIWVPWGAYPYSISANGGIYIGPTARGLARRHGLLTADEIAWFEKDTMAIGFPPDCIGFTITNDD